MSDRPGPRYGRVAGWAGRLLVGVAIVVALRRSIGPGEVFPGKSPWFTTGFALGLGLLLLAQLVSALRWRRILAAPRPSVVYLFQLYLMGQFASIFLPTSVGGDVFRAGALGSRQGNMQRAATSVLFDRLIGVLGLVLVFVVGLAAGGLPLSSFLGGAEMPSATRALVAAAALTGLGLLLLIPPVRRWVGGLLREMYSTFTRVLSWRELPVLLLLAVAVQLCYIGAWAGISHALGLQLSLALLFVAVPAVSLVGMLPISISGLGLRESAWVWVLGQAGADSELGVAMGLTYFAAYALVGVLGALWYLFDRPDPSAKGAIR